MSVRHRVCVFALAIVVLSIACQRDKVHDGKATLKLTIETDRTEYDQDDTIMVVAAFRGDAHIQLLIGGPHFDPHLFHTFWKCLPKKAGEESLAMTYTAAWELQLVERRDHLPDQQPILIHTESVYAHQIPLHFRESCGRLPPGKYELRIGYTLCPDKLRDLVKAETGADLTIHGGGTTHKDAFNGAVLSQPVTITIRPTRLDK